MADPQITAVVPRGTRTLRVFFDTSVGIEAAEVARYTLTPLTIPAVTPKIVAADQLSAEVVDLTLDIDTTPGASYTLAADGITEAIVGWKETYLARAVAKTGILAEEIGCYFDEFTDSETDRWIPSEGGSVTPVTTQPGGVLKIEPKEADSLSLGLGSHPTPRSLVEAAGSWYAAMRFKIQTDPPPTDGQAQFSFWLTNDISTKTNAAIFGYFCDASISNFVGMLAGGGSREVKPSTVVVDADWHVAELWHRESGWFFSVDDEDPIKFDGVYAPSGLVGVVLSGTSGESSMAGWVDKLLVAFSLPVYSPPV